MTVPSRGLVKQAWANPSYPVVCITCDVHFGMVTVFLLAVGEVQ